MPLAFSVMFFFFPAGLVLYWVVNNILSIAQQWLIIKPHRRATPSSGRRRPRRLDDAGRHATRSPPSPPRAGAAAIGIVRVSGRRTSRASIARRCCGRRAASRATPPTLPFRDADGAPIDQGLALYFPAPHSYTGEDVLELQGARRPGRAAAAARALPRSRRRHRPAPGASRANSRERAFLNDKLDLAQAEAVADLIDAEHRSGGAQRRALARGRVLARDRRAASSS